MKPFFRIDQSKEFEGIDANTGLSVHSNIEKITCLNCENEHLQFLQDEGFIRINRNTTGEIHYAIHNCRRVYCPKEGLI